MRSNSLFLEKRKVFLMLPLIFALVFASVRLVDAWWTTRVVANYNFDDGTTQGWTRVGTNDYTLSVVWSNEQVFQGSGSIKVGWNPAGNAQPCVYPSPVLDLRGATVVAWVRLPVSTWAQIYAQDDSGWTWASGPSRWCNAGEWTVVAWILPTTIGAFDPSRVAKIGIQTGAPGGASPQYIYIDSVVIYSSLQWVEFPIGIIDANGVLGETILVYGDSRYDRGPVGKAHIVDIDASNFVSLMLGRYMVSGSMLAKIDWEIMELDGSGFKSGVTQHVIAFGSPRVNLVSYWLNKTQGTAWFTEDDPNNPTWDSQHIKTVTGNVYTMSSDYGKNQQVTDYGMILVYKDGNRYVVMVAGLSGVSTRGTARWLSQNIETLNTYKPLDNKAVILRFVDEEGDFEPDYVTIQEIVSPP